MLYQPNEAAYRTWLEDRSRQLLTLQSLHPPIWNLLISVVIAAEGDWTDADLAATLQSLRGQNWHNLEVTVFAGARTGSGSVSGDVGGDDGSFSHLRGLTVEKGRGIGDLFRAGPAACGLRGDYVLVVPPGSVFEVAAFSALNRAVVETAGPGRPDLVLFDHEYTGQENTGREYTGQEYIAGAARGTYPVFLPGFDAELLAALDYIGPAVLIRAALFDRLARTTSLASVRDVVLAAAHAELPLHTTLHTGHVRDVLMRLPGLPMSAMPANSDPTAAAAKIAAKIAAVPKSASIAVIIPNRNKPELLAQCVASMLPDPLVKQLIIVDNASDSQDTRDLYEQLKRDHRATIVAANQPFNFSRMINLGVAAASADVLLLLNNDIEFKKPGALAQACAAALRSEVGIVGTKLLYPDYTIQHAGILLDYHPYEHAVRAMHIGRGAENTSAGYLGQYGQARAFQAVTGAFMMLRRQVFDQVGGFDEVALPVEFNDIDFCLRVGAAGYKILCLPLDRVFHHESASRGKADTIPVRQMRIAAQALMARRWLPQFQSDPYNHPIARLGEKAEVQFNFTGTFIG